MVTRTCSAAGEPSMPPPLSPQHLRPDPDPKSALTLTSPTRQGMKVTLNPIDQAS